MLNHEKEANKIWKSYIKDQSFLLLVGLSEECFSFFENAEITAINTGEFVGHYLGISLENKNTGQKIKAIKYDKSQTWKMLVNNLGFPPNKSTIDEKVHNKSEIVSKLFDNFFEILKRR